MNDTRTRRSFLKRAASTLAAGLGVGGVLKAAEAPSLQLDDFDDYVQKSMEQWQLPGLAVAIVKDGRAVHSRGYGVRTFGRPEPVDPHTIFPIASCTKAFTAAALAKLVDDRKIVWDESVTRHLPAIAIDPRITIRHALCHRSGLPSANMLWRRGDYSSDEILSRLKFVRPLTEPGGKFAYNNLMYLVAGRIVEVVSGRKWSEFVRRETLAPLRLASTLVDGDGVDRLTNLASPHRLLEGATRITQRYVPDAIAPAGAMHSNVVDMATWLTFHLEGAQRNEFGVLSAERIQELHAPPAPHPSDEPPKPGVPGANISRYGLGWFFKQHHGRTVIEHSGSNNGFVAWVTMVPSERFGFVILANQRATGLPSALRSRLLDECFGVPQFDWSEHVRLDYQNGYQRLLREAKEAFEKKRVVGTRPSVDRAALMGTYSNELYGSVYIALESDDLRLRFGTRFKGQVTHWMHNQFRVTFDGDSHDDWLLGFQIAGGEVKSVRIKEAPWAPAWYEDADDLGEFDRAPSTRCGECG